MEVTMLDGNGLPVLCACGNRANGSRLNTLGQLVPHCPQCDPSGPPCPLCEGSGHLPR